MPLKAPKNFRYLHLTLCIEVPQEQVSAVKTIQYQIKAFVLPYRDLEIICSLWQFKKRLVNAEGKF
jgi:hypothetical protein